MQPSCQLVHFSCVHSSNFSVSSSGDKKALDTLLGGETKPNYLSKYDQIKNDILLLAPKPKNKFLTV